MNAITLVEDANMVIDLISLNLAMNVFIVRISEKISGN
jgi:hypothetical protein